MNRKALKVRPNPSRSFGGRDRREKESRNQAAIGTFQQDCAGDGSTLEIHRRDHGAVNRRVSNPGSAFGARGWPAVQCALCLMMIVCLVLLSACGKGSTVVQSTGTSIIFTQVPPSPFPIGGQAQLIATVTNDPDFLGVNWSVSCGSSKCGGLSPAHSDSGAVTFYTAPNAVPTGNTVNITATSAYDPSKHVSVTITLTTATQQVGITFTQSPPGMVEINSLTMVTATVTNDPTNSGVDWQLTCAGGSFCGSVTPAHTSSGAPTTYTAPGTPPGNGGVVNIIAIATAQPMVTVSASTQVVSNAFGIFFMPAPPTSLTVGTQTPVTAVVVNDPTNAGVDWTVTCGSTDCGSFNPTHTASSGPTTYTAPTTVPAGNNVTIMASATADPTVNTTASIQITNTTNLLGLLNGQYAISISGIDFNGVYGVTGSLVADGNGNITSGEEDFADPIVLLGPVPFVGSYTIGQDGRGTMELCNQANLGVTGSVGCPPGYTTEQIISFAVVSSTRSLVIEFDSSATSHGSIDLQTASDLNIGAVTGGYSFAFSGISLFPAVPAALGGVFTADGNGNFTGGTEDINDNGNVMPPASFTGTYTTPDSFGRVTAGFDSGYTFVFYIVNAGQLNFVETDISFEAVGPAFTQGSGSFGNSSLSGPYGFTGAGMNGTQARAEGGLFTSDGGGNLSSGLIDVNDAGSLTSGSFTGSYAISSNGRGTATLSGTTGGVSELALYVTKSQGALLLELDSGAVSSGAAKVQGSGISASTFQGNYAAYYESHPSSNSQVDAAGQIMADGMSSLTGTMDVNQFAGPTETPAVPFTGTFTANSDGRFSGSLMSPITGPLNEVFYVLDSSTVLMLESDAVPGTGLLQLQNLTVQ